LIHQGREKAEYAEKSTNQRFGIFRAYSAYAPTENILFLF